MRRNEANSMLESLLTVLACPVCKEEVTLLGQKILCRQCKLTYPIEDGIPVMLKEKASPSI